MSWAALLGDPRLSPQRSTTEGTLRRTNTPRLDRSLDRGEMGRSRMAARWGLRVARVHRLRDAQNSQRANVITAAPARLTTEMTAASAAARSRRRD